MACRENVWVLREVETGKFIAAVSTGGDEIFTAVEKIAADKVSCVWKPETLVRLSERD